MQNRYDIRINPPRLSDEQISRHKDFDGLIELHRRTTKVVPFHRRGWVRWVAAAAAACILVVSYWFWEGERDYDELQAAYFEKLPYVNPPLPAVQPTFVSFTLDNERGGRLMYNTGSSLEVPPLAFVDSRGEVVSGEITLRYREMHDFVDFFLAGIPMVYDSGGVLYTLESAGMIEVYAEKNGEPLNLAHDKHIGVELVSRVNTSPTLEIPTGFNIYRLDEEARNWRYVAVDHMRPLDEEPIFPRAGGELTAVERAYMTYTQELQAIEKRRDEQLAALERAYPMPSKPVAPRKPSPDRHVFELDLSELSRPVGDAATNQARRELKAMYQNYNRMLWELSPRSTISAEQIQREFGEVENIRIQSEGNGEYQITLEKDGRNVSFYALPVLTGSEYQQASEQYQRDLAEWENAVAAREQLLEQKRREIEAAIAQQKVETQQRFQQTLEQLSAQSNDHDATNLIVQRKVVNQFSINCTGIWNCDRPLPPYMTEVRASFVNTKGEPYANLTGYIVDRSRNSLSRFLVKNDAKLSFNHLSDNLLWLVTEEGKLALCRPEQFRQIKPGTQTFTFVLEEIDMPLKTVEDARRVLYL